MPAVVNAAENEGGERYEGAGEGAGEVPGAAHAGVQVSLITPWPGLNIESLLT